MITIEKEKIRPLSKAFTDFFKNGGVIPDGSPIFEEVRLLCKRMEPMDFGSGLRLLQDLVSRGAMELIGEEST